MKDYHAVVREIERHVGSLGGKRVLDVGTDMREGGMVRALAETAADVVGINLVGASRKLSDRVSLVQQDVRKMSFEDESFDLIVSYAAFEHVNDFDVALGEMLRVLRPSGALYAGFGPIWSCKWGHHLWHRADDVTYTYQNLILPSYCHLYMSEDELKAAISRRIQVPAHVDGIAAYIRASTAQSRNMHHDYVRMINASGFEVGEIRLSVNAGLAAKYEPADDTVMAKLREIYPEEDNFDAASMSLVARRPERDFAR